MEGALQMKRSLAIPALLLCLLLTACGGGEAGGSRDSLWEELDIGEEEIVMTVDGREIPAWRYCRWLAAACGAVAEEYKSAGMTADWEAQVADVTLGEYVRRQAQEDTALYATVENLAEQYGVTITEEPTADADGLPLPLTQAQAEELDRVGLLYGGLCRLAQQGDSPLVDETAFSFWKEQQGYMTVDRIFFAAGEDWDAARQRAEEAFARLNAAEEKEPVFSSLAAGGDDLAGPRTLRLGDGTLETELETAAAALEAGQYSGILETEAGFSILCRTEADTAALRVEYFDEFLQQTAGNADIQYTSVYKSLNAEDFWEALEKAGALEEGA